MGVKERRARQKRVLRQEILDAASDLFVRQGYEQVSMRRIADKIEYSPTTIYLYFRDKAELLESVCNETFARLTERFQKISEQASDPLERLRKGLMAYIEFGLVHPQQYRATFLMPHVEGIDAKKYLREDSPGMRAFSFLRRNVAESVKAGKLPHQDAEAASQILWAGIHGITSLLILRPDFPWVGREKIGQAMVNTLVSGIGAS